MCWGEWYIHAYTGVPWVQETVFECLWGWDYRWLRAALHWFWESNFCHWKNSKVFYLLSHLSSPVIWYFTRITHVLCGLPFSAAISGFRLPLPSFSGSLLSPLLLPFLWLKCVGVPGPLGPRALLLSVAVFTDCLTCLILVQASGTTGWPPRRLSVLSRQGWEVVWLSLCQCCAKCCHAFHCSLCVNTSG